MSVDTSEPLILSSSLPVDQPKIDLELGEDLPTPAVQQKSEPIASEVSPTPPTVDVVAKDPENETESELEALGTVMVESPPTVPTPELPPDSTTSDSPTGELAATTAVEESPPNSTSSVEPETPSLRSGPQELPSSTAIDLSVVQGTSPQADIPTPTVIQNDLIQVAKENTSVNVVPVQPKTRRSRNLHGNLDQIVKKLTCVADPTSRLNGHTRTTTAEPQKTENDCQNGNSPAISDTSVVQATQTLPANGSFEPSGRIALDLTTKLRDPDEFDDGQHVKPVKWGIMKTGQAKEPRKKQNPPIPVSASPTTQTTPGPSSFGLPSTVPPANVSPSSKLLRIPQYVPQSIPQPQLPTEIKVRSEIRLGGVASGATVVTHSAQSQTVNLSLDLNNHFDKRFDPRPLTSSRASQAMKGAQIDLKSAAASIAAYNGTPFAQVSDTDKRRMTTGKATAVGGRLKNQPTQTSTISLSAFPPPLPIHTTVFPTSSPAQRPPSAMASDDVRGAAKRKRALRNSLVQTIQPDMRVADGKKPEEQRSVPSLAKVSSVGQQTTPIVRQLLMPVVTAGQQTMVSLGQQTMVSLGQQTPPGQQFPVGQRQLMHPVQQPNVQRVSSQSNTKTSDSFSLASIRNGSGGAVSVTSSVEVSRSPPVTDPAVIDRLKRLGTVIEVEDEVVGVTMNPGIKSASTSTKPMPPPSAAAAKDAPAVPAQPSALKMLETMTIDPPQSPVVSALDDRPLFLGKDISVFTKKKTGTFHQQFSKTPLSIIPVGQQSSTVSCLPKALDSPNKCQNSGILQLPPPLTITKAVPTKSPSETLKNLVPILTVTPTASAPVERGEKIIAEPDAVCFPVSGDSDSVMEPPLPFLEPVIVLDEDESPIIDGIFVFKHDSTSMDVFSCDICSAAFHHLHMLRKHYFRLHVARQFISEKDLELYNIDLEETDGDNRFIYRCHTCRQCLPTKAELKSHLTDHPPVADLSKHIKGPQVYRCDKCSAHFKWRKALGKHKKNCKTIVLTKPAESLLTKGPQLEQTPSPNVKGLQVVETPSPKLDEPITSVTELAMRQVIDIRAAKPTPPSGQHKSVRKTRQSVAMAVHSPPHIPQSEEPFLNRPPKMSSSETQTYPSVQQIRSAFGPNVMAVPSAKADQEKTKDETRNTERPDSSKATQAVDELLSMSVQVGETLAALIGDMKHDKKEQSEFSAGKKDVSLEEAERFMDTILESQGAEDPVETQVPDVPRPLDVVENNNSTHHQDTIVPELLENDRTEIPESNQIPEGLKSSKNVEKETADAKLDVDNSQTPEEDKTDEQNDQITNQTEPTDISLEQVSANVFAESSESSLQPLKEAENLEPSSLTPVLMATPEVTDPKKLHHCLYCNETFSNGNRRRNHTLSTHPFLRKNHRCVFCTDSSNESFPNLSALFSHLLASHQTIYFSCQTCKERYISLEELKEHTQNRHSPDEAELKELGMKTSEWNEEQMTFNCNACTRIFLFKKCFLQHKCDPEKAKELTRVSKLRKVKVSDRPERVEKPIRVDPEQMFYSQVALNVRTNLLHFLDGKLPCEGDSDCQEEEDPKIPERNTLSFSDGFPPSSYQLIPEPEPYSRVKAQWEKYNFPKNYDGRCGLTSYIKDMSYLDLSTQLIMRRNLQRLQGSEVPSPSTSNDVPSVLELERLATRRAESFGISSGDGESVTLGELSGEWVRDRLYVCSVCFWESPCFWTMEDHKYEAHPQVHCPQYELVGDQQSLADIIYKRIISTKTDVDAPERPQLRASSVTRVACTRCGRDGFTTRADLHVHILDCAGEPIPRWAPSPRKKRWSKKQRRQRRGLKRNIPSTPHRPVKVRTKPGDTDTIQKMIANLPAKRSTRRVIEADLKTRSQSSIQNGPLLLPNNRLVLPPTSSKYSKNSQKGGSPKAKEMILAPPPVPKLTDHIDTSAERGDLLSSLHMMPVSTPVAELLKPKQIFDKVIIQNVLGRQIEDSSHTCKGCGHVAESRNALRKHLKVCAYYRECGPHAEHQCKTCLRHYDSLVALIEHNCDEMPQLEIEDDASLVDSNEIPVLSLGAKKLASESVGSSLDVTTEKSNLQRERSHSVGDIPKHIKSGQRRSARLRNSVSGSVEMVNLEQDDVEMKTDASHSEEQSYESAPESRPEMLRTKTKRMPTRAERDQSLDEVKMVVEDHEIKTEEESQLDSNKDHELLLTEPSEPKTEEKVSAENVPKHKKRSRRRPLLTLKKKKKKPVAGISTKTNIEQPQNPKQHSIPLAEEPLQKDIPDEEIKTAEELPAVNEPNVDNDPEWETVEVIDPSETKLSAKGEQQETTEKVDNQNKQKKKSKAGKIVARGKNILEETKNPKKARIESEFITNLMTETVDFLNESIDVDMSKYNQYTDWTDETIDDVKPNIDLLAMTIDSVARGEAEILKVKDEDSTPVPKGKKGKKSAEDGVASIADPKKTKGNKQNVKAEIKTTPGTSSKNKGKKTATKIPEPSSSRPSKPSNKKKSLKDSEESSATDDPETKGTTEEEREDFLSAQRRGKKSTMALELRHLLDISSKQSKTADLLNLADLELHNDANSDSTEKRKRSTRSSFKSPDTVEVKNSDEAEEELKAASDENKIPEVTEDIVEPDVNEDLIQGQAGAATKGQKSKKKPLKQMKIDESLGRRASLTEEIVPDIFYANKSEAADNTDTTADDSAKMETLAKKLPGKKKGKGKNARKEPASVTDGSADLLESVPASSIGENTADETEKFNTPSDLKPKGRPYGNKLLSGRLPSASKYAALLQRKPSSEPATVTEEATKKRKFTKDAPVSKALQVAKRKTRSNSAGKSEMETANDPYDYNDEDEIVPFQEPRYKPYSPPKQPTLLVAPVKRRARKKEGSPDTTTIVVRAEVHPEPAPKKRALESDVNRPSMLNVNSAKRKSPPTDISPSDAKKMKLAYDNIDTVDDESSPPTLVSEVNDETIIKEEPGDATIVSVTETIPAKSYSHLPKPPSPLSEPPKLVDESKVTLDSVESDSPVRFVDPSETFDSEPPALEPTGEFDLISKSTSGEDTPETSTPADTETDTDSLKSGTPAPSKKLKELRLRKKKQLLRIKAMRNKKMKKDLRKNKFTSGKEVVKMSGFSWEVSELNSDVKPVQKSPQPPAPAEWMSSELWESPLVPPPATATRLQPLVMQQPPAVQQLTHQPPVQPPDVPLMMSSVPPIQASSDSAVRSERSDSTESGAPNANIGSILDTVNKLLGESDSNFSSSLPPDYSLADLQKAMGASDAEMAVLQQLGEASSCLQEFDDRSSASQSYYGDNDEWGPMIMDLDNQPAQQAVVSSSVIEPPAQPAQPLTPPVESSTPPPQSESTSSKSSLSASLARSSFRDDIFGLVRNASMCKSLRERPKCSSTSLLDAHHNKEVVCPTCCSHFMGFHALQTHVNKVHGSSQHDPTQVSGLQQNRRVVLESGTSSSRLVCFECQQILPSHLMYRHFETDHNLDASHITKCSTVSGEQHAGPVRGEQLKNKMSSALGDLFDKAVNNLLTSKTKPEPSSSGLSTTAMELLRRLVAIRRRDNSRINPKDLSFNKLKLDLKEEDWLRPQTVKPYLCSVCGQRFPLAASRNKHEALAHKSFHQQGQVPIREEYFNDDDWRDAPSPTGSTVDDDGGGTLKPICSDCGLSFGNVSELLKHRVDDHTPLRRLSATTEAADSSPAVTSSSSTTKVGSGPKKINPGKRSQSLDHSQARLSGDVEDSNSNASTDSSSTAGNKKGTRSTRGSKNPGQTVKAIAQEALRNLVNDGQH